jgi:hypothetical protein
MNNKEKEQDIKVGVIGYAIGGQHRKTFLALLPVR